MSDKKELAKLVTTLNKKFGTNAVTLGCPRDAEGELLVMDRIPTGSLSLNHSLGGGLPVGRFIEISGHESASKTTESLHIIREAQKKGFTCALLDVEGTTDDTYLKAVGVDVESLIYMNPDGLEEATQALIDMQRSGLVQLAVLDSIASLEPTRVIEKDMDETDQLGQKPKLLGKYFGVFTAGNNRLVREGKTPFTLVATNQLREKIGQYGDPSYCLHYDTRVVFTDGRSIPIGKVVKEKIKGKVWSLNEHTGSFEPKDIVDWHDNGYIDNDSDYIHIESRGIDSLNGIYGVTVTYNHKVLTDSGWKEARNLTLEDSLITRVGQVLNGTLLDFLYGTFIGDTSLVSSHIHKCIMRFQDKENPEYLQWKVSKISPLMPLEKYPTGDVYRSNPYIDLQDIKNELGNRNPLTFFQKHYSDMGLALWYMDDGNLNKGKAATLSVKRFKGNVEVLQGISDELSKLGMSCSYSVKKGSFYIPVQDSINFFNRICKYVPDSMQYKLPDEFKGRYEDFELENEVIHIQKPSPIINIRPASAKQLKRKKKYDISVGDNHNYVAGGSMNGVVVHNSPGGKAKEYFASITIRLRKGDWISEGTGQDKEIVGQVVKYLIPKNKTYKRMQTGEFDFYFAENSAGVAPAHNDNIKEIIMLALTYGVIERRGAWFYISETDKYNGTAPLVEALKNDQNLFDSVHERMLEASKRVVNV